ncbi:MAG: TIGR03619 family F420-dependent LLM class oxidoreductase [Myxococcota bacterium]
MAAITRDGTVRFGLQLPIQTLTRTLVDPWEEKATPADLVAIAKRCDERDLDFVGVCDHVAIPDDDYARNMSTTWYDTVATLGFLAAQTSRIRLVSTIWVAAYRHPLQTAKAFGTLSHLSNGRVILGVGAGHVRGEFEALGIEFETRGRRLDESLRAIRGAFDAPYVSHAGEFYRYAKVGVGPGPRGALPIWIGGRGRNAWRRVGRFGDGWIPMANDKRPYSEAIDVMRAAARAAGRGEVAFDVGYMPAWAYLLGPVPASLPTGGLRGGAEGLVEDLRAARAVGANTFHLRFRARSVEEYLDQLDAFRERVWPEVARD